MDETAALDLATARYRETEATHEAARQDTIAAVIEALKAGIRPTDVIAHSPFTAAYVRRIARENGIEPASKKRASRPVPEDPA